MKRSLFNSTKKQFLLAIPAAALMLGAAQAGTTVGLNFQSWYYDSGSNPQTIGFGGSFGGYATTGFPVTAKAFGVDAANWWNTDPLPEHAPIYSTSTLFGSTSSLAGGSNTFAGMLTLTASAPSAGVSGIGEQVGAYVLPETVPPGNDEVTWGFLDDSGSQTPTVTVSGLQAEFPNGYVVETIAAVTGVSGFNNVDVTDGTTTNVLVYSVSYVTGTTGDGYYSGNGSVGLSSVGGEFTGDSITIQGEPQTSGNRSTLAGFILTDQPVLGTTLPPNLSVLAQQPFSMAVSAIGVQPLTYIWRTNGVPIPGAANSPVYAKASAASGDSANYDVVVTNISGSVTSSVAVVNVQVAIPHAPEVSKWDADTNTPGAQDGSGVWNYTPPQWWTGTSDDTWWVNDTAIFGAGGTGDYTVTLGLNMVAAGIIFNSGNYTIAGTSGETLSLSGAGIITANTNGTITAPISGTNSLTKTGPGTLILGGSSTYSGGTIISQGEIQLNAAGALGTNTVTLGDSDTGTTNVELSFAGVSQNATFPDITVSSAGTGLATISGTLNPGGNPTPVANVTMQRQTTFKANGTAAASDFSGQLSGPGAGAGNVTMIVNGNGGNFRYTASASLIPNNFTGNILITNGTFQMQNLSYEAYDDAHNNLCIPDTSSVTVAAGATWSTAHTWEETIDGLNGAGTLTDGYINHSQAAYCTLTVGGGNGNGNFTGTIQNGDGMAFTKIGTGTQILGGINTYTGPTIVSNGTLVVSGQLTGGSAVTLNDSTTLNIAAGDLGDTISAADLTLGSSGTGPVTLGFANPNSTTVAPINVTGTLFINNPVIVNISGVIPATGQYPLIQYSGGEIASAGFSVGTLPAGVSATVVDDQASSVYLNVTATPVQTEVWSGDVNGNWDVNNTANWLLSSITSTWANGNIADFDDTAAGTTAITLTTNVYPSVVTFNNSVKNYSFSGTGAISGAGSLNLNGTGTVTLDNTNSYSGGTVVNSGTLAVSADSNLGTGGLSLAGTLDIIGTVGFASAKGVTLSGGNSTIQVDNTAGASFTSAITGSGGSLTKTGNGKLTLAAQETYGSGTIVNGGTLNLADGGSSGTLQGALTINSNATVITTVNNALGYSGANWVQNITLNFGTLNTAVATDNGWGTTINMTGGTMGTTVSGGYFAMGDDPVFNVTGTNVPSVISANLTDRDGTDGISFNVTRGTAAADLEISGNVLEASAGGITLAGGGIMELSGNNNTYTGPTVVQAGTLVLAGRLIGGGAVTVNDGAILDVMGGVNSAIITTNDLTLGEGGTVTLDFGNISSPTVPLVSVGNVALNDAVTVNITGKVGVGQFPLIKYAGAVSGAGSYTLGSLPAGVSASLYDNVADQSLDLVVTSSPLSIITDISSGTNYVYAGTTYSLVATAGGNPTIGYQWYYNNTPIAGATTASLSLTRVSVADTGSYYAIATNASGAVSSSTNYLVVLPVSGSAALVIATTPTAIWPLNETNGPVAVDYMGGHNGTYSSGGVTYNVAGPLGTSVVTLDGFSGQVAVPYSSDLNPSNAFTAEAWLNPASVSSSLVCALASVNANSPRAGWLIYCSTAGWEFRTYNQNATSTAVDITGGTPTPGVWNHVAVVWDGTYGYIYVDGVLQNTSPATNYVANGNSPVTIGSRSDSAFFWGGSVGDVAMYNRALTSQEIQTHAQNSPSLRITPAGGQVIVSWVPSGGGTLVASPVVTGPYTNIPAATSPWTNTPAAGNQFYRVGF